MKRILVVEDNAINADLIEQLLEDDYLIVLARNGVEAIKEAVREPPDLVLMDLSMPQMDDWTAVRQIKTLPGLADLPIVALTAHAIKGERERALAAGFDAFLTKPIDEDMLFATLASYL